MQWDAEQRRYEDDDGNPLIPAEVRSEIHQFIEDQRTEVRRESARMLSGEIQPSVFFQYMRGRIDSWHSIAGAIAYGGEEQLDDERDARIEQRIQSELDFLDEFEQEAEASFEAVETIAEEVSQRVIQAVG